MSWEDKTVLPADVHRGAHSAARRPTPAELLAETWHVIEDRIPGAIEGANKLWALKSQLEIPIAHVAGASVR